MEETNSTFEEKETHYIDAPLYNFLDESGVGYHPGFVDNGSEMERVNSFSNPYNFHSEYETPQRQYHCLRPDVDEYIPMSDSYEDNSREDDAEAEFEIGPDVNDDADDDNSQGDDEDDEDDDVEDDDAAVAIGHEEDTGDENFKIQQSVNGFSSDEDTEILGRAMIWKDAHEIYTPTGSIKSEPIDMKNLEDGAESSSSTSKATTDGQNFSESSTENCVEFLPVYEFSEHTRMYSRTQKDTQTENENQDLVSNETAAIQANEKSNSGVKTRKDFLMADKKFGGFDESNPMQQSGCSIEMSEYPKVTKFKNVKLDESDSIRSKDVISMLAIQHKGELDDTVSKETSRPESNQDFGASSSAYLQMARNLMKAEKKSPDEKNGSIQGKSLQPHKAIKAVKKALKGKPSERRIPMSKPPCCEFKCPCCLNNFTSKDSFMDHFRTCIHIGFFSH